MMKNNHIIKLLEERGFGESDLKTIRDHIAHCDECARAYEAAQLSSQLLRERAAFIVEPSPFFQTRVMAAIREKKRQPTPSGIWNLWPALRSTVAAMAGVVLILAGLSFFPADPADQSLDLNADVVDLVFFDRDDSADNDLNYDQVLTNLYESDVETKGGNGKQ
jgi:hypothetical protein